MSHGLKVLVTGRSGQVATSLIEAAGNNRLAVVHVARPDLDLTLSPSMPAALAMHAPDIVVNAAAYTAVDRAENEEALAFAINASGAGQLATACAERGIPIIHLSTDYVFDGGKEGPYEESDAVAPLGAYGRTKLEGERLVAAAGPRHLIVRTAWVYSPWGGNFVKTMLRLAATKSEIGVVDDQVGTPTYAPHLAAAICTIAEAVGEAGHQESERWGLYHLAGAGEATWCEFAKEVFAASARLGGPVATVRPIPTSAYPTAAVRPMNSRLDTRKALVQFGVALPHWREGVEDCVRRLLTVATG